MDIEAQLHIFVPEDMQADGRGRTGGYWMQYTAESPPGFEIPAIAESGMGLPAHVDPTGVWREVGNLGAKDDGKDLQASVAR